MKTTLLSVREDCAQTHVHTKGLPRAFHKLRNINFVLTKQVTTCSLLVRLQEQKTPHSCDHQFLSPLTIHQVHYSLAYATLVCTKEGVFLSTVGDSNADCRSTIVSGDGAWSVGVLQHGHHRRDTGMCCPPSAARDHFHQRGTRDCRHGWVVQCHSIFWRKVRCVTTLGINVRPNKSPRYC